MWISSQGSARDGSTFRLAHVLAAIQFPTGSGTTGLSSLLAPDERPPSLPSTWASPEGSSQHGRWLHPCKKQDKMEGVLFLLP